jgi:outer membrane protease
MKIGVLLFLIGAACLSPAFSQDKPYPHFFSGAGTFFTVGSANEYVYTGSTGPGLTSQLTWPIPLSWGAWTSFGVRVGPHWEFDFRFEGSQALLDGNMTDQDWNIYDSDGNAITHQQSTSTSYLDSNWEFRAETAFPFPLYDLEARPLVGAFYHQYYWEAWGGTLNVSYASGATGSGTWYGTSATYRQEWFVPYVGFELKKDMTTWSWGGALRISPYLFANNTDEHVLRGLTFNDSVSGGFMIEPSLNNEWVLLPNVSLQADVSYRLILGPRGAETVSSDGSSTNTDLFTSYTGSAGADVQTFTASLGLKVAF